MGIGYNTSVVRNGLVLYLDAANRKSYPGSGTTWTDLTGNGYNGILLNGPIFESDFSGGINCDPINDMVYVNNTFNILDYFTIDVLYRRDSSAGVGDMIIYNKESVWELRDLSGDLAWAVMTTTTSWFWHDTGYNVAIGQKLLVSLTFDGSSMKTYVDGILVNQISYTGTVVKTTTSFPKLNSRGGALTTWQNGGDHTFYQFKIYNRALSAEEIYQNYEAVRGRYGI